jgi:hypothetical protein
LRCARPSYAEHGSAPIDDGCFELGNTQCVLSATECTKVSTRGMAQVFEQNQGRDILVHGPHHLLDQIKLLNDRVIVRTYFHIFERV